MDNLEKAVEWCIYLLIGFSMLVMGLYILGGIGLAFLLGGAVLLIVGLSVTIYKELED